MAKSAIASMKTSWKLTGVSNPKITDGIKKLEGAFAAHRKRGLTITIGSENKDPSLSEFTLVTASYRWGDLTGVVGVLGPTRMPYEKVIGLVEHTSRLVEGLLT